MNKIEFLGAAGGEVTGSCYLLTAEDTSQILVDFGMFQGDEELVAKNYELLSFNPADLEAVFITHGHLDHCGRLPLLMYRGFKGKIYMTAPTKEFVEIILNDSAKIAAKDLTKEALYTSVEVQKTLAAIEIVQYDTEVHLKSFTAVFRDAGHILGSSSIEITDISSENKDKIVFSGDLGNTPEDIVKPTQYIASADYVVMESTYGDSLHPDENAAQIIQEEINAIESSGGVLMIPAFAIERTQEILHIIHHLKADGKVRADTTVYVDSPMGAKATAVYLDHEEFCNEEFKSHKDIPFNFNGIFVTEDFRDSKDILKDTNPKVIVSGSGMMSGGRILHHAVNYLPFPSTRVLFVGYQAEETLGRQILNGARHVTIEKVGVKVNAKIREIKVLSSHADQPRLIKWLEHIKGVKKVFLTHGERKQQEVLAEKIKTDLHIQDILIPGYQEEYTF
jgi:metallo-beta-lactamase family protein